MHRILVLLLGLAWIAQAQALPPVNKPIPLPPKPAPPPAPLLQLRIIAPQGAEATFYPNSTRQQGYAVPTTVGVRPGYTYRFKLGGLGTDGKSVLFPTLEVIGTLQMPCWINADKHPVPVVFQPEEIEHALRGAFITKVFLIEHPDLAVPIGTQIDDPIETSVPPNVDLLAEARTQGRPLLVVRFGHRQYTDAELHAHAIEGTMLLATDKWLPFPDQPPHVPFACMPFFDPILGPRYPEEECMYDGGDTSPAAGFDPTGELAGLNPSDSVAEYVDNLGTKRIAVSNRVCICVPRFVVVKTEVIPEMYDRPLGPLVAIRHERPPQFEMSIPPLEAEQIDQLEVVRNRTQPSEMVEGQGPVLIDQLESTALVIGEANSKLVVGVVTKECPPEPAPLVLCKRHDTPCGQIGDVVTFHLSYTNPGGTPINDVVVSDSLTGRLEYVPGSQKSDRDAVFTTQENEAGSVILRWQIKGVLQPGQSGTVSFQAKIR